NPKSRNIVSSHRTRFSAGARAATSFAYSGRCHDLLNRTRSDHGSLSLRPITKGQRFFATTSLRRNCHPRNRFCHVPSPVGRGVGVAADARMAMDGHILFRATETTEATGNICLLLGVLL